MNNVTDTDRKAAADKLAKDKPGEVITAEDTFSRCQHCGLCSIGSD
jgi:hypothetical protein